MIKSAADSKNMSRAGNPALRTSLFPRWFRKVPLHLLLVLLLVVMLLPFLWMIGMSLKPDVEASPDALDGLGRNLDTLFGFFWPQGGIQWSNYVNAWNAHTDPSLPVPDFLNAPFTTYYINSLVSATAQVLGVLFTSTLAAFAFARLEFYGKNILFGFLLATLTIPYEATYLPNLVIVTNLHLSNTLFALFVPWMASVFSIFLLRQFFMTIPVELYEAGQMDGLGDFGYLWRVALPLSTAAVLTSALFTFMGNWNALLWPLIASPKTPTVQLGLENFISNGDTQTQWNLLMAASTISILPIIVIYFFVQRRFIEGIARTGIK